MNREWRAERSYKRADRVRCIVTRYSCNRTMLFVSLPPTHIRRPAYLPAVYGDHHGHDGGASQLVLCLGPRGTHATAVPEYVLSPLYPLLERRPVKRRGESLYALGPPHTPPRQHVPQYTPYCQLSRERGRSRRGAPQPATHNAAKQREMHKRGARS